MKKNIFLIFFCVVGFSTFADTVSLEAVCGSLSENRNMTGRFLQEKTISAVNRTLRSSGIFIFSDLGIVWKTEKPFPSVMAVGLDRVVQTLPNGKKTVMDASQNQIFTSISKSLSAMFRGDQKTLVENFSTDFSGNSSGWTVRLVPKDLSVASILGSIEVSGKFLDSRAQIDGILMSESSGDSIKYIFSEQKFPEELSQDEKSYFTFR